MTHLLEQLETLEATFTDEITRQRHWLILPSANATKAALYSPMSGLRYSSPISLRTFLDSHPFVHFLDESGQSTQIIMHVQTRLLWYVGLSVIDGKEYSYGDAKQRCEALSQRGSLANWQLPENENFRAFCAASGNPYRREREYRLQCGSGSRSLWLVASGLMDVDKGELDKKPVAATSGHLLLVNKSWEKLSDAELLINIQDLGWQLMGEDGKLQLSLPKPDNSWQGKTPLNLMFAMAASGESLATLDGKQRWVFTGSPAMPLIETLDYRPSRLPKLEINQMTDPHRGLWELWGAPESELLRWNLRARNPSHDIKTDPVAIDFGTSSTVVAVKDGTRTLLLRVGARDYYAPIQPTDFENPTIIELLDYQRFSNEWFSRPYRPEHDWDWLRMGHEARASWNDNPGDTAVLSSILPRLKSWALRDASLPPQNLTDRLHGHEIVIPSLAERTLVRGQPLAVNPQDPFDPIEFYAFQLGMAINWRGRGLYMEYYLSFPAKYDSGTKAKIRASFARGLQRSLPRSLISQTGLAALQQFRVVDLASEPAAYAAAALSQIGLAPDEQGVAYAVFDFGGGTTDFDFGLWRRATPDEEDEGYEMVFEHLESSGDNYLGGEQLLEHLAYRTLCANLDALRSKRIHFSRPADAEILPGSESFIQPTRAAQTNMVMLIAKLRSFWESHEATLSAQIKLDLLDANGQKQTVELVTQPEALDEYLQDRINQGCRLFLQEMARAFANAEHRRSIIHVLLAGNASRSRYVRAAFDLKNDLWKETIEHTFGAIEPEIILHEPLPVDPQHPYAPTAKTGVALGLLKLVPGNGVKVVDHMRTRHGDETSFRFFFGRLRSSLFEFKLSPEIAYKQWVEIGPISDGYFNAYFTSSPRARGGMGEADTELMSRRIVFPEAARGNRLWARAVSPDKVDVCCVAKGDAPQDGSQCQTLSLRAM